MELRNEIIDTMRSLRVHPFVELYGRFVRNVNTENMPAWGNVWKAYHLHRDLECLKK